ncbi:MAG TPA: histidine kinase [Bacillus bacterium]|nr:histidine kinase [Bacillus sp. (in: firmicutes)]
MEVEKQPVEFYKDEVLPVVESKMDEFRLLGYDRVSLQGIWDCLQNKKWRKKEDKLLHEVVADILSLQIGDYMSYLTIEAYKGPDFFAEFETTVDRTN